VNDRHLDPPEFPELPECCGMEMECDEAGVCICSLCGDVIAGDPEPFEEDPEELEDPYGVEPPMIDECAHGRPWGDCGDCDHAGDLAFDAAREARLFGR
jgi:hypothetical protein